MTASTIRPALHTPLNKERVLKTTEKEADNFGMTRASVKDGLSVTEFFDGVLAVLKGLTVMVLQTGNPGYLSCKVADVGPSTNVALVAFRNTLVVVKCTVVNGKKSEPIAA